MSRPHSSHSKPPPSHRPDLQTPLQNVDLHLANFGPQEWTEVTAHDPRYQGKRNTGQSAATTVSSQACGWDTTGTFIPDVVGDKGTGLKARVDNMVETEKAAWCGKCRMMYEEQVMQ